MFWVGLVVGLLVGWNLLAQPKWVEAKATKLKNWVASKI